MKKTVNKTVNKAATTQNSLERALELLGILNRTTTAMNVAEISKVLGVTRITANTMLQTLMQHSFVEKDESTGKYVIGYRMYEMAMFYRHRYSFLYVAEKHVNEMSDRWRVKVNVGVLKSPGVVVVLLSRDASAIPRMIMGHAMPAYATASGKLLMAYEPRDKIEEWLSRTERVSYTPFTTVDLPTLCRQMDSALEQGYALEQEELTFQRSCVASPIRDFSGRVIASVSFSSGKDFLEENFAALTEDIVLLGKMISYDLGYTPIVLP
ncbi:MAG: IclR family transcriptional regulator [Synergistaceae bacterium]|jgi:IclR family pca regulon transcriptional regulator|nr:IclR family transcriptional regulator [Synergistaceae bacterium]